MEYTIVLLSLLAVAAVLFIRRKRRQPTQTTNPAPESTPTAAPPVATPTPTVREWAYEWLRTHVEGWAEKELTDDHVIMNYIAQGLISAAWQHYKINESVGQFVPVASIGAYIGWIEKAVARKEARAQAVPTS